MSKSEFRSELIAVLRRLAAVAEIRSTTRTLTPQWEPTPWCRVLMEDGSLWCETSDVDEAREMAAELGRPVQRMWREVPRTEWRDSD